MSTVGDRTSRPDADAPRTTRLPEPAAGPLVVNFARELRVDVMALNRAIDRGEISVCRERTRGRKHVLRVAKEDAERIRARFRKGVERGNAA